MDKIKYIVCDLDGTLLNTDKEIDKEFIEYANYLKNKYSIEFGIATGRDFSAVKPILEKLDIDDIFSFAIVNNGAEIINLYKNERIITKWVSRESINQILEYYSDKGEFTIAYHYNNYVYTTKYNERVNEIVIKNKRLGWKDIHESDCEAIPRVMILVDHDNYEYQREIILNMEIDQIKGVFSETDIFEINDIHVHKAMGVALFLENKGDSLNNVLSFGDSENDYEFLTQSKIGVAMFNAKQSVQDCADDITKYSNLQQGVLRYLQEKEREIFENE